MKQQERDTEEVQQKRTGRFWEYPATFANNSCSRKRRISLCLEILFAIFIWIGYLPSFLSCLQFI